MLGEDSLSSLSPMTGTYLAPHVSNATNTIRAVGNIRDGNSGISARLRPRLLLTKPEAHPRLTRSVSGSLSSRCYRARSSSEGTN